MNWFCNLRRWIRVYVCFLLPILAIGIAVYFKEFITVAVFSCLILFITLPLFIYTEEIRKDNRDEEMTSFIRDNIVRNQKTEIDLIRSVVTDTPNKDTRKETPNVRIPDNSINIELNVFPVQATLSGLAVDNRKNNIINSDLGDILTISHSEKADHPNTFYVLNDRLKEVIGSLPLTVGTAFTKLYGRETKFIGKITYLKKDAQILCNVEISGIKE